jgi:hypothetical protein
VLHHHHRIAFIAQFHQQFVQTVDIPRVQSEAGLVKDIHDIHKAAAQMLNHLDALGFAPGQRVGRAIQAQVFQANLHQVLEPLGQRAYQRGRRSP